MPVALEVGKATFHLFNTVKWVVIAVCAVLTATLPNLRRKWFIFIIFVIILAAQTFWLLPALDVRADAIIAGAQADATHYHWSYIALEVFKLLLALVATRFYLREGKSSCRLI